MNIAIDGIINSLITNDIIAGAILGSIIIPLIFYLIRFLYRKYISILPANSLLGEFRNNNVECLFFLKELYDVQKSNKYLFKIPDFFPPHTTGKEETAINIPRVFAKSDAECLNDFVNVLGAVGKTKNIKISSLETEWDIWNKPIVSIGGNYKTNRIFERCKPIYVEFGVHKLPNSDEKSAYFKMKNEKLFPIIPNDYGLIHKTKDKNTDRDVFIIMGLGCLGTTSAGKFFRNNFQKLGKMYGHKPFAIIVKSKLYEGGESYEFYDYNPEPSLIRKFIFPFTWFRMFRPVKNKLNQ